MQAKTQLVLWDWNGTLLNDVQLCVDALNRLLQRHGYAKHYDKASYQEIFGFPIRDYYLRAGFDFDKHPFSQLAESYMADYVPASAACPLTEGAAEALAAIHAAGIPQVILSASPVNTLHNQVTAAGIAPYFETMLGLGDIYAKSKVDLGQRYLAGQPYPPSACIMIGDSVHDFEVSQAMGTRCLLYAGGHQTHAALASTGAPVLDTMQAIAEEVLRNAERPQK